MQMRLRPSATPMQQEIKTPFYGERLDGLMRARSNCLRGIVNGIDYNEYNPETDPIIEYITTPLFPQRKD